jgi:hypothetical protein
MGRRRPCLGIARAKLWRPLNIWRDPRGGAGTNARRDFVLPGNGCARAIASTGRCGPAASGYPAPPRHGLGPYRARAPPTKRQSCTSNITSGGVRLSSIARKSPLSAQARHGCPGCNPRTWKSRFASRHAALDSAPSRLSPEVFAAMLGRTD